MKKKAYLSKPAEADLDDIWLYVAQDSVRNADRFIAEPHDKCALLAFSPGLGRRRDELIEVVRILSGHRDIEAIFCTE